MTTGRINQIAVGRARRRTCTRHPCCARVFPSPSLPLSRERRGKQAPVAPLKKRGKRESSDDSRICRGIIRCRRAATTNPLTTNGTSTVQRPTTSPLRTRERVSRSCDPREGDSPPFSVRVSCSLDRSQKQASQEASFFAPPLGQRSLTTQRRALSPSLPPFAQN